jgi:hypothetical protein
MSFRDFVAVRLVRLYPLLLLGLLCGFIEAHPFSHARTIRALGK